MKCHAKWEILFSNELEKIAKLLEVQEDIYAVYRLLFGVVKKIGKVEVRILFPETEERNRVRWAESRYEGEESNGVVKFSNRLTSVWPVC